jgi:TRAP-type C4-dicarboxylate transport system permease small subunit
MAKSKFLHQLDLNAERWFMLIAYAFCCFAIVQEVLRRFLLNHSSAWAEETARYAFIYLGWVGAAYAVRARAHIRFDILLQVLPKRLHGYFYLFGEAATLAFACVALYFCSHTMQQLIHFGAATPVLRINKAWFEAAVFIGFLLIFIRCIQAMVNDIADLRAGRPANTGKALFES